MENIGLGNDRYLPAPYYRRMVQCVCGASYDYGDRDFLDFSTRAGRQFVYVIIDAAVRAV